MLSQLASCYFSDALKSGLGSYKLNQCLIVARHLDIEIVWISIDRFAIFAVANLHQTLFAVSGNEPVLFYCWLYGEAVGKNINRNYFFARFTQH